MSTGYRLRQRHQLDTRQEVDVQPLAVSGIRKRLLFGRCESASSIGNLRFLTQVNLRFRHEARLI